MTLARYLLGVAGLVCVLGGAGRAGAALRDWLLPGLRGAPARLGDAVLGLTALILALELLGTVGLLRLVPVVLAGLALGLGVPPLTARLGARGAARRRRIHAVLAPAQRAAGAGTLGLGLGATVISVLGAGVVLAEWAGVSIQSLHTGVLGFDSVAYHLPWAASYAQTGQITQIRFTDTDWLTGFYPASSELIQALGIVLLRSDVLAPVLNLGWLALALLAAWCIGAARGVGPATLLAAALALALPMMFFSTPGSADSDACGIFCVLAAVALWLAATPAEGAEGPGMLVLVPAGAAAGLAIGTKLNMVAPALAVSVAAVAAAPAARRLRAARTWTIAAGLAGGFWYLRNLVAVGNPLPYFSFGVLPVPSPPPAQAGNNLAISAYFGHLSHVASDLHRWTAQGFGPAWPEILAVAVLGGVLCLGLGPGRTTRLLGLAALAALVAYVVTPGSASGPFGRPLGFSYNLRYCVPALVLGLTAAPLAAPVARGIGRWLLVVLLVVLFAVTLAEPELWGPGYSLGAQIAVAAGLLALGLGLAARPWHAAVLRRAGARAAGGAAVLVLAGAGVAAGYGGERHYLRTRYRTMPRLPTVSALWRWADRQHGRRIAVGGTFGWYFAYPLYGSGASNTVVYLGAHRAHGAFTPYASCRAWRAAINRGHYDDVVTSSTRVQWRHIPAPAPEAGWTAGDPAARLVLDDAGRYPFDVWRIVGRLRLDC